MGGGGSGRAARALRLLVFAIMALAAVEYLSGSILEASLIRTYLYSPGANSTQASVGLSHRVQPMAIFNRHAVPLPVTTEHHRMEPTTLVMKNTTIEAKNSTTLQPTLIRKITNISIPFTHKPHFGMNTKLIPTSTVTPIATMVYKAKELNQSERVNKSLSTCDVPSDLGPIKAEKADIPIEKVEMKYPEVQWGGHYIPPNCSAKHRVAIIIPYRDRAKHLAIFLNHMHKFLMKQQIEYGIFIVEQHGRSDFNRAKLMNVGFVESQKLYPGLWQCFIFHDVDLLPTDTRNLYSCPRQPRHMSAAIDKFMNRLPYETIFGGVSAMTREQFVRVNGFSNKYWGWGAEDDDMYYRLKLNNYHIARYKMSVARYAMLDHDKQSPNPKRYQLLSKLGKNYLKDGLTTLQYQLLEVCQNHLFTHVLVDIDEYHGWKYIAKMLFGNENS